MSEVEQNEARVEIPKSGVVYGDIIYWGTIAGSFLTLIGSIITFVTDFNHIDTSHMLSAVWEGKSVDHIWEGSPEGGEKPDGHWYLDHLPTGHALTMAGLAMGVFSVIPGLVAAGFLLIKEKREIYGAMAFIAAVITIAAMLV